MSLRSYLRRHDKTKVARAAKRHDVPLALALAVHDLKGAQPDEIEDGWADEPEVRAREMTWRMRLAQFNKES